MKKVVNCFGVVDPELCALARGAEDEPAALWAAVGKFDPCLVQTGVWTYTRASGWTKRK